MGTRPSHPRPMPRADPAYIYENCYSDIKSLLKTQVNDEITPNDS